MRRPRDDQRPSWRQVGDVTVCTHDAWNVTLEGYCKFGGERILCRWSLCLEFVSLVDFTATFEHPLQLHCLSP